MIPAQKHKRFYCSPQLAAMIQSRMRSGKIIMDGKPQVLTDAKLSRVLNCRPNLIKHFLAGTGTMIESTYNRLCEVLGVCE